MFVGAERDSKRHHGSLANACGALARSIAAIAAAPDSANFLTATDGRLRLEQASAALICVVFS